MFCVENRLWLQPGQLWSPDRALEPCQPPQSLVRPRALSEPLEPCQPHGGLSVPKPRQAQTRSPAAEPRAPAPPDQAPPAIEPQ